jgi:hypothetical protein
MKKKLMLLLTMLPFILIINGCIEVKPSFVIVKSIDTVEINSEYTDLGALYKYGTIKETVFSEDSVDISVLGLYELNYIYEDQDQAYSAVRYVIVVDQTKPSIELNPGVDTVYVGANWIDRGAVVGDNSLELITPVMSGIVNTQITGTYEVIYTATDSSGNVNSISRFVTVITQS